MPISQTAERRPIATVMFFVAVVLLVVISLQQLAEGKLQSQSL